MQHKILKLILKIFAKNYELVQKPYPVGTLAVYTRPSKVGGCITEYVIISGHSKNKDNFSPFYYSFYGRSPYEFTIDKFFRRATLLERLFFFGCAVKPNKFEGNFA